ncbi:MAG: YqeG family HAD IIIA-type phosphatase [Oscillospiraceae bacterium]|nr:YqeG family HAD IIIA-type phosphatase [Oscillospiraceae bacterium]
MSKFNPDRCVNAITDITVDFLCKHDIQGLTLDLDNVLAPYKQTRATTAVATWLAAMRDSGIKLMVLSNAGEPRVSAFCAPLGLQYIANAGKPHPANYRRAAEMLQLPPKHIAMVGDQIFTDVHGAKRSGFYAIRVAPIDLSNPFHRARAWVEKPFLRKK